PSKRPAMYPADRPPAYPSTRPQMVPDGKPATYPTTKPEAYPHAPEILPERPEMVPGLALPIRALPSVGDRPVPHDLRDPARHPRVGDPAPDPSHTPGDRPTQGAGDRPERLPVVGVPFNPALSDAGRGPSDRAIEIWWPHLKHLFPEPDGADTNAAISKEA